MKYGKRSKQDRSHYESDGPVASPAAAWISVGPTTGRERGCPMVRPFAAGGRVGCEPAASSCDGPGWRVGEVTALSTSTGISSMRDAQATEGLNVAASCVTPGLHRRITKARRFGSALDALPCAGAGVVLAVRRETFGLGFGADAPLPGM